MVTGLAGLGGLCGGCGGVQGEARATKSHRRRFASARWLRQRGFAPSLQLLSGLGRRRKVGAGVGCHCQALIKAAGKRPESDLLLLSSVICATNGSRGRSPPARKRAGAAAASQRQPQPSAAGASPRAFRSYQGKVGVPSPVPRSDPSSGRGCRRF